MGEPKFDDREHLNSNRKVRSEFFKLLREREKEFVESDS